MTPTRAQWLLRALGHLPVPGVQGAVRRLSWYVRNARRGEFEVPFAGLRYRGRLDDLIDWTIFSFGSYAPRELDFLAVAALHLKESLQQVSYFDIGANVGQHALFMSRHATEVFAFEPSEAARMRFMANIELNQITNIRLFPFALGDENRVGRLGSGFEGNTGSRSLTWTLDESRSETVSIRRGDEVIREQGLPRIDILKLDVEGYEKLALNGLRAALWRDRPIILTELIGETTKGGFRGESDLRATLYPDHELYSLFGEKIARLGTFNWNIEAAVCLPREHVEAFKHLITS